jgi:ABC-type transport system substrate-binding protein
MPMSPFSRPTLSIALVLAVIIAAMPRGDAAAQGQPDGQITIAFDAAIASSFLDPAETVGLAPPFAFLYALHDALAKPLPGNDMAPCLAESWRESPDGLTYEFKLRQGVRFHSGDPVTAEDVRFSFQRYRGVSAKLLHDRVRQVEVVDPQTVRFVLQHPWPDFLQSSRRPGERDRKRREAALHQIQRPIHERVMHRPIFEPATLHGVGPRVEEAAIGLNSLLYIAAPYEEMRLKKP